MQCLSEKRAIELTEYSLSLTISKAKDGTALSLIKKENPGAAYKSVSDSLTWLQNGLNINNKMCDEQIADASITIVNTYYWLRLEEVIMILAKIKTGKTGKLYHSFDIQVFCSIIEDYLSSEELAIYNEQQAKEFKKAEKEKVEMSEQSRKRFQEIYQDIINQIPEEKEEPERDEKGRLVQIRDLDYFNQLKSLIPEMTDGEIKSLQSIFISNNYRDGLVELKKEIEKRQTKINHSN